jgi:glycosyltransferase involved in cell wall biosynthesis
MKILYLNHTSKMGGAERSLLSIVKKHSKEHDVVVLLFNRGELFKKLKLLECTAIYQPVEERLLNIKRTTSILSLLTYLRSYINELIVIRKTICDLNPNLIHINSFKSLMLSILSPSKIPLVFHSRDIYLHKLPKLLLNILTFRMRYIIAVSEYVKNNNFYSLIKPSKIVVIHNGFELSQNIVKKLLYKWPRKEGILTIGIIGEVAYSKGVDRIIDIYHTLNAYLNQEIRIHIYGQVNFGSKKYLEEIMDKVTNLGITKKIIYKGYCDNIELIMSEIDIVISLSRYPEAFGRTLVEGMLHNKIVFSTPIGGALEIIRNGQNGMFWSEDMQDNIHSIQSFLSNKSFTVEILNETRNYAIERFDIEQTNIKLSELYKQI